MDGRTDERVHRLEFDVEWPPGHVACYLVDGPEPILVDAAIPDSGEFEAALEACGRSPGEIEHLLITHPHVDHIGEVPTVLEAGDPTVYAPTGVAERLRGDPGALEARVRRNCEAAGIGGDTLDAAVSRAVESLERDAELLAPEAIDVALEAGERVAVGDRTVEPIHLPGHQAEHMSYRTDIGGEAVLLAGDMGIEPFRPIAIHDGLDDGYREAFDAFYAALDRMADLDVGRVYPGHGPIHADLAGIVERDRRSLDRRLDSVAELVESGIDSAPEIAAEIGDDRAVVFLPEVMSALAHLEATGRIEPIGGGAE